MRTILAICLAFAAALLGGCFPLSLNPIYNEQDKVFLPQLAGIWTDEDSEQRWTFTANDSGSFRLELKGEEGEEAFFTAQLARAEGVLLLDFFPDRPQADADGDLTEMHLLGLHSFAVIHQIEPTLRMSFMPQEWLGKHLGQNPAALSFIRRDDRLILTSSTNDLQKFVIQHLQTEGAFDPMELRRLAESD